MPKIGTLADLIQDIWDYCVHVSKIFPEDTDETVTITAGGTNNTFGDWAELADNNSVTLSSKFTAKSGYIVSILLEEADTKDVRYLLEIAYCATKTVVARSRFMKVNTKLNVSHQMRIRSLKIPKGEIVYYRLKCETASATAEIQVRYYIP